MGTPIENDATRTLKNLLNISEQSAVTDESPETQQAEEEYSRQKDSAEMMSTSGSVQSHLSESKKAVEASDASVMSSYSDGLTPRTLAPVKQTISLSGNDQEGAISIYGNEVDVIQSSAESSSGSSKVKFHSMVNYEWERRYYTGNLLAINNVYIAYTLKARDTIKDGAPTSRYVVRVLNPQTVRRALIKGFTGRITDISFAHRHSNTLACVDEAGNLFIWEILEEDDKVVYNPKVIISRGDDITSEFHRLVWCPHIITEDELQSERSSGSSTRMDEGGRIIAVTHNNEAEVYDLDVLYGMYNSQPLNASDIPSNCCVAVKNGHVKPITDGALSPDGRVLATSSQDGYVKFWQIAFDSAEESKCLHNWKPHNGKPVSCLLFCDNHTSQDESVPFWRFLITGTQYNSELKVWCTVTWSCLQTIRFSAEPATPTSSYELVSKPCLKAHLDLTASYLVLSDINKKVLYVFLLHQDMDSGKAHLTSVSEFLLAHPVLSFVIREARLYRSHTRAISGELNGDQAYHEERVDEEQEDDSFEEERREKKQLGLLLKILSIQTHSLQELAMRFQPEPSVPPPTPSELSMQSQEERDLPQDYLSDVSCVDSGRDESQHVAESHPRPKLITPDAFTLHKDSPAKVSKQEGVISSSSSSSITMVSKMMSPHEHSASDIITSISSDATDTARTMTTPKRTPPVTPQEAPTSIMGLLTSALSQSHPVSPDPSTIPIPSFQSTPGTKEEIVEESAEDQPVRDESPVEVEVEEEEVEEEEAEAEERSEHGIEDEDAGSEGEEQEQKDDASQALLELLGGVPRPSTPPSMEERKAIQAAVLVTEESVLREVVKEVGDTAIDEAAATAEMFRPETPTSDDNMGLSEDLLTPAEAMYRESRELIREQLLIGLEVSPQKHTDIPPESSVPEAAEQAPQVPLDQIIIKLSTHESMIWDLRQLLIEQQRQQAQNFSSTLREEVNRLEYVLSGKMESVLADHGKEETKRIEKVLKDHNNQEKQRQEKLASSVSQSVSQAVNSKLDKAVKTEMKNSVLPAVQKSLGPVTEQLNTTLAQKLTATDAVLKESITKMVKSKAVVDAIASNVASCLQGPIQVTYKESFQSMVIPAFERACQGMFQQINESFQRGTQQYLNQLEAFVETLRRQQEDQRDPIVQQLRTLVESFQIASERLSSSLSADLQNMISTQITSAMQGMCSELLNRMEDGMVKKLQDSLQETVQTAISDHSQQFGDASYTGIDGKVQALQQKQEQLKVLIDSQNYAVAFQDALSASNLDLVMFVCKHIDVELVFDSDSCILSQPVLLSLIQQLSVDLLNHTELKYRYLEEAIYALDTREEITKQHMPGIIQGLYDQLEEVLQHLEPSDNMYRSLSKLKKLAARQIK